MTTLLIIVLCVVFWRVIMFLLGVVMGLAVWAFAITAGILLALAAFL